MISRVRKIGLHIRLSTTVADVLERALRMRSDNVQCFFIKQETKKYVEVTPEEIELVTLLRNNFDNMYVHGSYWINLAGAVRNGWRAFQKELAIAESLTFTHMIIHPGAATGCKTREEGIVNLARALDKMAEAKSSIKIVLENAAHGKSSIGGSLQDFKKLLELSKYPEKLLFCIDTAHAHSYGYNISSAEGRESFFNEIVECIGKSRIALLHLNETEQMCGSCIDQHAPLGCGMIGNEALQAVMYHDLFKDVPIVLELPAHYTENEMEKTLAMVKSWDV